MRLGLQLELEKTIMSLEYRREILSFIKAALTKYKDGEYFEKYFENNNPTMKPYCYGTLIPGAKFKPDKIELEMNHIKIYFSTFDYFTGITFYNAFNGMKNYPYPLGGGNTMTLKNINLENEKCITSDEIKVKFISPLCVRKHDRETNKDFYMSFQREGFNENLLDIITAEIKEMGCLPLSIVDGFSIEPIQAKKTIVKHYDLMIETSVGTFTLKGDPALLHLLYLGGIGSRRSGGFGLFDLGVGTETKL